MPSMMRRMRTRLPTYLSTGLGALVDIANTPWDHHVCGMKRNESGVCLRHRYRQIPLGVSMKNQSGQFEQYIAGSFLEQSCCAECEWHSRSVNWRIFRTCRQEVRFATRRLITKIKAAATMMAAGISPTRA